MTVENIELKSFVEDEDLNKYNSELKEDLKITKTNVREKSMLVSSLRCKWLNYYFFEKENLKRLTTLKEKYTKTKIGAKNISDPLIRMKSEVAMENGGDEKITKVTEMIKQVKNRIDFLERVQGIMNDFGYNVRNSIELFKLEGGI